MSTHRYWSLGFGHIFWGSLFNPLNPVSRFLSRKPQCLSFCEFQHLPLLALTYLSSKYIVGAQQSLFFGAGEEEPLKEL